jgi:hypothetical protein
MTANNNAAATNRRVCITTSVLFARLSYFRPPPNNGLTTTPDSRFAVKSRHIGLTFAATLEIAFASAGDVAVWASMLLARRRMPRQNRIGLQKTGGHRLPLQNTYGALQKKFGASSMLPVPLYLAT